ncbi:hypothetical protein [Mucilaginibacter sp.]
MPLEDISQFLGHKSIYSTEVYTHIISPAWKLLTTFYTGGITSQER